LRSLLLAVAALAACSTSPPEEKSDWERKHEQALQALPEPPLSLPPYAPRGELLEFTLGPTSSFRYFVDASSLSVAEGIVRYVLVARSAEGVENVSYEGMRCASGEVRIYAVGRAGGWSGAPGAWRNPLAWHRPLYREYFCRFKQPIRSPEEGIAALRR
jgi:hypothetical protein